MDMMTKLDTTSSLKLALIKIITTLCVLFSLQTSVVLAETLSNQPLDKIAAVVNNDVVMFSEVRSLALRLKKSQKTPGDDAELIKEALDSLVLSRLQAQKAKEIGLKVDDSTLNEAMESIAKQNNLNLEQFRTALIREGLDYTTFRNTIREKILIETLRKRQQGQRENITEQEIDDLIQSESPQLNANVEYHLQDILVPLPNGASVAQFNAGYKKANKLRNQLLGKPEFLSSATLKKFNASGKDLGWKATSQLPVSYVRTLSLMQAGEISGIVRDQQGFHILKLVEQKGGQRRITQQVHARHILIPATEPNARLKATQLRQQIQAGGNFEELAKKFSADKGSAQKGGDLGTADPASYVAPFAEAVRNLPLNTLSPPVQTRFGWHLIEVLERKESDQTRDALVAQAQSLLSEKKQSNTYKSWLNSLKDSAFIEYRL